MDRWVQFESGESDSQAEVAILVLERDVNRLGSSLHFPCLLPHYMKGGFS